MDSIAYSCTAAGNVTGMLRNFIGYCRVMPVVTGVSGARNKMKTSRDQQFHGFAWRSCVNLGFVSAW